MPPKASPRLTPTRRDAQATRTRLLEAAGEVFAQQGFDQANMRQICDNAQVNLGAVKYYFGSKELLYREVLVESHHQLASAEPLPQFDDNQPSEALRLWMRFFLRFVLICRPAHPYIGRILMHELARPTAALDDLVQMVMMPVHDELARIVAALLDDAATPSRVKRVTHLILLMCVQHEIGRPILQRLGDNLPQNNRQLNRLVDQLHQFVIGGIEQIKADEH